MGHRPRSAPVEGPTGTLEARARAGQVGGLEGPRVAEASVMPAVMRAHTRATTMMMAERVPMASAQGIRRKT